MPLTKGNNFIIGLRGYCFVICKSALSMTHGFGEFRKTYLEYIFVPVLPALCGMF